MTTEEILRQIRRITDNTKSIVVPDGGVTRVDMMFMDAVNAMAADPGIEDRVADAQAAYLHDLLGEDADRSAHGGGLEATEYQVSEARAAMIADMQAGRA